MAGRAVEEPEADLTLELADQQAQPGRRDEERLCGAGEVLMLRDKQEGAQLSRREVDH